MKKFICLLTCLAFVCITNAEQHPDQVIMVDGINYCILQDSQVAEVRYSNSQGDVSIPSSITYNGVVYRVTSIGDSAFERCAGLTSITIPNSVVSIGLYAFKHCDNLTSIVLPNSITRINSYTFSHCVGLTTITIPSSVTSIGYGAFGYLNNGNSCKLSDVFCYTKNVPDVTDPFIYTNIAGVTLHVPEGSVDAYKAARVWKDFKKIVPIAEDPNQKYMLTYMVDEEVYRSYEVKAGSTIIPIDEPTKDGYEFSGWSEIPEEMPAHDVVVTGTFTKAAPSVHTITYIVDGEVYVTAEYSKGDAITPESEPTKEGYTFSGWSEIPGTMPGNDVTVTGSFTVNKYKLTYMIDGTEYKTVEVEYGSTITPEDNPTMDGYNFSGWSDIPDTMPASDVVVTGSFSKGTYTLTYILDDVEYKTCTYDYDESITPENVPDKEGYTFTGWDDLPNTMPGHDVTVTGTYTVNKYKLIYMVDGEVYMTIEVEYGASITPEDEPTKDGYVFSGWSWMPSKMPAEDVTVSGTFKQIGYNIDDNIYVVDGNEVTLAKSNVAGGDIIISPTVIINNNVYNVTTIGQYAFANNNCIKSVTIPDGVTTIGDNAFEGCSGIKRITLGKDVGFIGRRTFAYIFKSGARTRSEEASLTVECHADKVPGAYYDSFEGTDILSAVLKVNDDLVSTFKATSPWNGFGAVIGFNEAEALGIGTVMTAEKETEIFSIDGRRLNKTVKGMNIIRTDKGVKKLYRK